MYTGILEPSVWSTFVPEGHIKIVGSLRMNLDESNHPYSLTWHRRVSRFFHRNEIVLFKVRPKHLDPLGYKSCGPLLK